MKKVRGKPKFVDIPWATINECAYSNYDLSTHNNHMAEARYAAAAIAMADGPDDVQVLKRRAEFMAYYIVQVQTNNRQRRLKNWAKKEGA